VSDSDSFIQEVTEEVRRDRMYRLWRRYAPFVIGAIVLVVLGTAVMAWLDHRREAAAREAGAQILRAAEASEPARRAERLLAAADGLAEGPAMLARLRAAAELAAIGDRDEALALFDGVARQDGVAPVLADFAALRAAMLRVDAGQAAQGGATLDALIDAGSALALLALEARAGLRLAQGDVAGARADLERVLGDAAATEALRLRAAELAATLGPA